jgi:hypothetical protein
MKNYQSLFQIELSWLNIILSKSAIDENGIVQNDSHFANYRLQSPSPDLKATSLPGALFTKKSGHESDPPPAEDHADPQGQGERAGQARSGRGGGRLVPARNIAIRAGVERRHVHARQRH